MLSVPVETVCRSEEPFIVDERGLTAVGALELQASHPGPLPPLGRPRP